MKKGIAHLLPDTNMALHWKRLDEIDWPSATGAGHCIMHIAPVFLRELEQQKVHNRSPKLRERAAATIRWLSGLIDEAGPIELRRDVELRFIAHDPLIDFASNRLNERIADDVLLASALELAQQLGETVGIATDDAGLRVKLRSRASLATVRLPEEDRLPTEADPDQKELAELRREMARIQTRCPKLVVAMEDGETFAKVDMVRDVDPVTPLDEVRTQHEPLPPKPAPAEGLPLGLRGLSFDRNAAFNTRLELYFSQYADFEREHAEWASFIRRSFVAAFKVENAGAAPAQNIDVIITLPEGVTPVRMEDAPKRPRAPILPSPDRQSPFGAARELSGISNYVMPDIGPRDGRAYIRESRNAVEYDVASLKHGFMNRLDSVLIVFDEGVPPHSFEASFQASCNETDAVEGTLRFAIDAA